MRILAGVALAVFSASPISAAVLFEDAGVGGNNPDQEVFFVRFPEQTISGPQTFRLQLQAAHLVEIYATIEYRFCIEDLEIGEYFCDGGFNDRLIGRGSQLDTDFSISYTPYSCDDVECFEEWEYLTALTAFTPVRRSVGYSVKLSSLGGGIPEPATWAMMIAGFGLVGATARRRAITPHLRIHDTKAKLEYGRATVWPRLVSTLA